MRAKNLKLIKRIRKILCYYIRYLVSRIKDAAFHTEENNKIVLNKGVFGKLKINLTCFLIKLFELFYINRL